MIVNLADAAIHGSPDTARN